MPTPSFTESVVEDAALAWLESLGYAVRHLPAPQSNAARQAGGLDIAQGEVSSAQAGYDSEGSTCRRLSERHQDALR